VLNNYKQLNNQTNFI